MVVIHRIFRRELPRLAQQVRVLAVDGRCPVASVAAHLDFVLFELHNHHATEDEFLWPMLLERLLPDPAVVRRMEEQHEGVAQHAAEARRLLDRWPREPTQAIGTALAEVLERLADAVASHFDEEEAQVLPLVTVHLTAHEWEAFDQRAGDKFPKNAMPIMVGQLLEVATPDEAAMFLRDVPPPARLLWHLIGRRQYRRYISLIEHEVSAS